MRLNEAHALYHFNRHLGPTEIASSSWDPDNFAHQRGLSRDDSNRPSEADDFMVAMAAMKELPTKGVSSITLTMMRMSEELQGPHVQGVYKASATAIRRQGAVRRIRSWVVAADAIGAMCNTLCQHINK